MLMGIFFPTGPRHTCKFVVCSFFCQMHLWFCRWQTGSRTLNRSLWHDTVVVKCLKANSYCIVKKEGEKTSVVTEIKFCELSILTKMRFSDLIKLLAAKKTFPFKNRIFFFSTSLQACIDQMITESFIDIHSYCAILFWDKPNFILHAHRKLCKLRSLKQRLCKPVQLLASYKLRRTCNIPRNAQDIAF